MSAVLSNSPSPPTCVFVYGTLMSGQSNHKVLGEARIVSISPASISGDLLDLGGYPALRLSSHGKARVYGELIELEGLDTILERLDEFEGPEFRREIVNVATGSSNSHFAWTYVLATDRGDYPVIPSGNWRAKSAGA